MTQMNDIVQLICGMGATFLIGLLFGAMMFRESNKERK